MKTPEVGAGRKVEMRLRFSVLLAIFPSLAMPASVPGDSRRGAALFESQRCVTCHGAPGAGGISAPDLGRWTGRAFTPASLATHLWNHAPVMWSAMEKAGLPSPALTVQQAADLFAYFYAHRYFESPGEAGRGKQVFMSAKCGSCHAVRGERTVAGAPPPLSQWRNVSDPIAFTSALWNHSARMYVEMKKRKIDWPDLSAQQLTDLLVYVRRLPGGQNTAPVLEVTDAREGEAVFRSKGCAGCHSGAKSLDQIRHRTLASFSVAMWNHAPRMAETPPELTALEMRQVAGYLWSISYFDEPGNVQAGARVYAKSACQSCHASSTWMAPSLTRRAQPLDAIQVVSALWRHGPAMQTRMREQKIAWPQFKNDELADLIAYVNSKRE